MAKFKPNKVSLPSFKRLRISGHEKLAAEELMALNRVYSRSNQGMNETEQAILEEGINKIKEAIQQKLWRKRDEINSYDEAKLVDNNVWSSI